MSFSVMSSIMAMRLGSDFRNQMWATGRGQLDVAHALAAHARQGDLDAALLADDALVLHALVLAAQALVVLGRAEDAGAEQAVTLGLEGAVVDGLGLLDLAERPRRGSSPGWPARCGSGRRSGRRPTGLKIFRTSWFMSCSSCRAANREIRSQLDSSGGQSRSAPRPLPRVGVRAATGLGS